MLTALKWFIMVQSKKDGSELNYKYDLLGYCDKEVEQAINTVITNSIDKDKKLIYNQKGEIV